MATCLTRALSTLPEPLASAYSIECVLGVGAYAVVYLVSDKVTSEEFALKVIEKEPLKVRLMLDQLAREISLLQAHTDTPHVVELLESTVTTTHVFLRFKLCQESLEDLCNSQGGMSEDEAMVLLRQACEGVAALHSSGVIHRDLKPSNFLLDEEGQLYICDLGWACEESDKLQGRCGTPDYAPPEAQLSSGPVHTKKVDIYGLGASVQHMLLGRPPKGPRDLPKGVSHELRELLADMLDADPEDRPTIHAVLAHPLLAYSVFDQIWNQWSALFSINTRISPIVAAKQLNGINGVTCGFAGFG